MTGLNHVLTGTAIALIARDPVLVVPIALVSHFILDMIPHFDHAQYRYGSKYFTHIMTTDALLSFGVVLAAILVAPELTLSIALGALFAILPDFFWLYYYKNGRPQWWFFKFHTKIQWFERPHGAIVELSYVIFISTVIFAVQH